MELVEIIKRVQRRVGVKDDGNPKIVTWTAIAEALEVGIEAGSSPSLGGKWPKESEAASFYGASDGSSAWESANLVTFEAPYALFMDGQLVRRIRCHRKVENSLFKILLAIQRAYPTAELRAEVGIDQYDGCYNFRNVRQGNHLSMHAYGAAIDFDAAHNPLGATQGRMPAKVVEIFKAEGWRWGGEYSGRKDLMHFEACS